jgi:asparagine synthase (glutamine-hydrolysing)
MCGIAGLVSLNQSSIGVSPIDRMTSQLYHRGPDFGSVKYFKKCHLGHRRLSIIDLDPEANQPFNSEDGKYSMVYNGEIYNYKRIRKKLESRGMTFRTKSDTEVLLKAFLHFGPEVVHHLNGIFAFAIWNEEEEEFFAARDHIGVKPFYYTVTENIFAFASEIKALLPVRKAALNRKRVGELLQFGAVSGKETIFQDVFRLLPGHCISIKGNCVNISAYYDSAQKSVGESSISINDILLSSIDLQMVSDVPVGTMCSGGVDSSYIAVESSVRSDIKMNAYTIRIPYQGYDETSFAQQVVQSANLHYNELVFEPVRARKLLPTLIWLHDEPLRHPNSIPIFEVSRLAKEKVTVLLSGEGADEIFGGYSTYKRLKKVNNLRKLPSLILKLMLKRAKKKGKGKEVILAALQNRQIDKLLALRSFVGRDELGQLVKGDTSSSETRFLLMKRALEEAKGDEVNALMFYDQNTHLQTLLDRQDKMCMGNSIESRVPFLDHRLVSLLNQLPSSKKLVNGETKSLLRSIARNVLPESIFNRPKYPFGIPLFQQYLNDPQYQDELKKLVTDSYLVKEGILNATALEKILGTFFKGTGYYDDLVWNIYNLELWCQTFIKGELNPKLDELPAYKMNSKYANLVQ